MKNFKLIGLIIATAVATAAAVLLVLQKSRKKNDMRFDSDEFDDDDFMNDVYNCNMEDDLDVDFPEEEPEEEQPEAEKAAEQPEAEEPAEAAEPAEEALADVMQEMDDKLHKKEEASEA